MLTDPESYGARTDQTRGFHMLVYETVQKVPYARVTSYGHIAKLIGAPENSRQVGFALKHLPRVVRGADATAVPEFNVETVPWQRIIGSNGKVPQPRARFHHIEKLREEIVVGDDGSVQLSEYGWFPNPETWDEEGA